MSLHAVVRVRWNEWSGPTPWVDASSVETEGPWLEILRPDGSWIFVPDHIVRGRVEIEPIVDGAS